VENSNEIIYFKYTKENMKLRKIGSIQEEIMKEGSDAKKC